MAFPVIDSISTPSDTTTNATTHTVNLPTGITSGDLLLMAVTVDGTPTPTWPTDWVELDTDVNGTHTGYVVYKEATGSEGATVDYTTDVGEKSCEVVFRISGHADPGTQAPESNSSNGTGTTAVDPPSLSPTGGSKDYLWFAFGAIDYSLNPITAYPYELGNEGVSDGSSAAVIAWDYKTAAAASENPGAFTSPANTAYAAFTVAIHPGGAAGATIPIFSHHYTKNIG